MIYFYALLILLTGIIVHLGYKIFIKTKDWSFVIGIFFLYYWSLLGAWFFVIDDYTGIGESIGLHYHYMMHKLFMVQADADYFFSLIGYGLFIIVIEVVILQFTKPKESFQNPLTDKIFLNHYLIIFVCIFCSILSLSLVWNQILIAAKYEESVYYITRHYPSSTYTLHQLLNQISIVALYLGLITFLSGTKAKFFKGSDNPKIIFGYIAAIIIVEGGLLFLGNKREIMFAGIFGLIFYLNSSGYKVNWRHLGIFFVIIGFPLFFNDALRSFSPVFLTHYFDTSGLYFDPPDVIYTQFSVSNAAFSFLFSNEMFAGHFSMYGSIHKEIDLTYGSSIKSLIASGVPRFIYPDRPLPIYEYYIAETGADKTIGFTIHHAAGWFLNFGWIGIVMGASLIGWIWAFLYNAFHSYYVYKNKVLRLFFIIGMGAFVAFLPSLLRSGPEGYKALFFEALILPSLIILFSSDILKKNKNTADE